MAGLDRYFGNGSIIGQQLGLQAFNQEQDNQALQGATSLQQMFQNEQMNPLKVQQQSLDNQTAQAQLPGIQATSGMLQRKNSLEEEFMPQERRAKQSGYDTKLSDDQISQIKNFAQKLAFHPNPKMRELGASILENDADVIRDKSKQKYMADRQLETIRETGRQQRLTQKEGWDMGRWHPSGGGKAPPVDASNPQEALQAIQQGLASGKLNYEKASTMVGGLAMSLEMQASLSNDPAQQQQYTQMAAYFKQMANAFAQKVIEKGGAAGAAPKAGATDLSEMGIVTNPNRPAEAFPSVGGASAPAGAASAPAKVYSLQELKQIYPEKTEQQLREQAKKAGATIR